MNKDLDLLSIQKSISEALAHFGGLSTFLSADSVQNNNLNKSLTNLQIASDIIGELDTIRKSDTTFDNPIDYETQLLPWHEQLKTVLPQLAGSVIPGAYIIDIDSLLRILYQKKDISRERQMIPIDGVKLYFMIKSITSPQLSFGIVGFKGDYKDKINDLKTFAEDQFEPCKPC
ncbi:MAG: hypothetical protein MUF58_10765 [Arcicella sp.]|jgi:hypothetical protein|nr:hypothetical protein [Arcicella sp.]